jgi:hypothetical protein
MSRATCSKVKGQMEAILETAAAKAPGRNDPCPCGSGRKYKQCCLDKDEAKAREARAKAAQAPDTTAATPAPTAGHAAPAAARQKTQQPWKKGAANTRGFQRVNATRKVGGGG